MSRARDFADLAGAADAGGLTGKNLIINGNFDVWQRGTSFSNVSGVYTADRMLVVPGGGTTGDTVSQQSFTAGQTDVPGEPTYFLRYAMGSTSSNKVVQHRIEDVRTGAGQPVTLSFYAKASTGHTSTIEMAQVFGSGGSSQVTQSAQNYTMTTSWQKFTFTITLPSISGKTIGTSSYVYVSFIRSLSASNVTIDIAQMQLEVGETATPFERRSYGDELRRCQRYTWKLGGFGSDQYLGSPWLYFDGNNVHNGPFFNPVQMRAQPSMTQVGSPVLKSNGGTQSGFTFSLQSSGKEQCFSIQGAKTGHGLSNVPTNCLNSPTTSDYFIMDAEL